MYWERIIGARSPKFGCRGQAISVTYSDCVSVALVTHHALHMCRITRAVPLVARLAIPYFLTISKKWHEFWRKRYYT